MTTTTATHTATAAHTTTAPTLAFVVLHVADFAAASAYYTDTLGFAPNPATDGPDFRQFAVREGGIPFAIAPAGEGTGAAGSVELYFATPDIEGVRAIYAGKGAEVGAITQMPFGEVFTMAASDGEQHFVWQPQR